MIKAVYSWKVFVTRRNGEVTRFNINDFRQLSTVAADRFTLSITMVNDLDNLRHVLLCDNCYDVSSDIDPKETVGELKRRLQSDGWVYDHPNGEHFCPACALK